MTKLESAEAHYERGKRFLGGQSPSLATAEFKCAWQLAEEALDSNPESTRAHTVKLEINIVAQLHNLELFE